MVSDLIWLGLCSQSAAAALTEYPEYDRASNPLEQDVRTCFLSH